MSYYAAECRKARNPATKEQWLAEWHFEQRLFDLINDSLPDRYKVKRLIVRMIMGHHAGGRP